MKILGKFHESVKKVPWICLENFMKVLEKLHGFRKIS